jgi:hypothetical protein
MALLAFSAVVFSCFLLACVILLVLDLRGERRAVRAAVQALGRRVQSQDEQLGNLSRAVALLVPPDARPTTGPSRPFRPTAEHVAAARSAHAGETARRIEALSLPSVETEGDRGGINPGDPIPSGEDKVALRARFEPEADERDAARDEADEPEEEATVVCSAPEARHTLLGGLAGAPHRRPASSPTRAPEAFRAKGESPTLISAGVAPRVDPVVARYEALCSAARAAGLKVDHCTDARADCHSADDAAGACFCTCDGCVRATAYLVQAEREIMGPPQAESRGGRE